MAAATTTTPSSHQRSDSKTRQLPSRPITPLRPPSRTSLRASQSTPTGGASTQGSIDLPLTSLEPAFAELSDSMADLEANFMHLQLLNESLARFNENFGAFLYGMNMSAFCVDFPEAPIPQSFARNIDTTNQLADSPFHSANRRTSGMDRNTHADGEMTFMTNDTSFVENPPTSSKPPSKYSAPPSAASSRQSMAPGRGSSARAGRAGSGIGRGSTARARGSGIARGATRGVRGGVR